MNSPFDQTVILGLSAPATPEGVKAEREVRQLLDFVEHGAECLNECLDAGPILMGMVQGSAFCGALSFDSDSVAMRCLISPEELTASMVTKLLEEAPDE